jgi:hypothetical protein
MNEIIFISDLQFELLFKLFNFDDFEKGLMND